MCVVALGAGHLVTRLSQHGISAQWSWTNSCTVPGGESAPDRDMEEGSESLHLTDPDSLRAAGADSSARHRTALLPHAPAPRSDLADNSSEWAEK